MSKKTDRKAASIIANLLASTLDEAQRSGRSRYCWEDDGLDWLSDFWKRDPNHGINARTADYVHKRRTVLEPK